MELKELDKIFIIDFEKISRIHPNRPAYFSNLDPVTLNETIFKKLITYFPELKVVSPNLTQKIKRDISTAMREVNDLYTKIPGITPPTFAKFLQCFIITAITFKPQNEADKLFLWKYVEMRATNDYKLAS